MVHLYTQASFPKKLKTWLKTQTTILSKLFVIFNVHRQTVLYYVNMSIKKNNRFQMFLKGSVLKNFRNILKKTPLLESLFNKFVSLQDCNFIQNRLQHRCFPVNVPKFSEKHFYRTPLVAASALKNCKHNLDSFFSNNTGLDSFHLSITWICFLLTS